jgi:uncharacterized protein (DUF736 family)
MKKQWEERSNSGSLFFNQKKSSDKAPDFTGTLTIGEDLADLIRKSPGSVQFRLAGWKKVTSTGNNWLSISVSNNEPPKNGKTFSSNGYSKRNTGNDDAPWE